MKQKEYKDAVEAKMREEETLYKISRIAQISLDNVKEQIKEYQIPPVVIHDFYAAFGRFPTHEESVVIRTYGLTPLLTINRQDNKFGKMFIMERLAQNEYDIVCCEAIRPYQIFPCHRKAWIREMRKRIRQRNITLSRIKEIANTGAL